MEVTYGDDVDGTSDLVGGRMDEFRTERGGGVVWIGFWRQQLCTSVRFRFVRRAPKNIRAR